MFEKQETVEIATRDLLERVVQLAREGYRLVQIGCTRLEEFQIDYSFDKDYKFLNLRLRVPAERPEVPSISGIYWSAFTYENEIHDLFGVDVKNINVDYGGNFYRIEVKAPFNVTRSAGEKKE